MSYNAKRQKFFNLKVCLNIVLLFLLLPTALNVLGQSGENQILSHLFGEGI